MRFIFRVKKKKNNTNKSIWTCFTNLGWRHQECKLKMLLRSWADTTRYSLVKMLLTAIGDCADYQGFMLFRDGWSKSQLSKLLYQIGAVSSCDCSEMWSLFHSWILVLGGEWVRRQGRLQGGISKVSFSCMNFSVVLLSFLDFGLGGWVGVSSSKAT